MCDLQSVNDFEELAKRKLDENAWYFLNRSSGQGYTKQDNSEAFKRYRLRPTVLNDVSSVDMTTKVLGSTLSFPVCVAPTALSKLMHPDGEIGAAKAAAHLDIAYTSAVMATTTLKEIHKSVPNVIKWFQLYIHKDRSFVRNLVKQSEENGFTAIFVTVDSAAIGIPCSPEIPANIENGKNIKGNGTTKVILDNLANQFDPSVDWSDIEWLKSITSLPIVLKGILTGEMAELAVKHKVDGIVVSNHGGRQLDGVQATIDVLSEVVQAVNGRIDVYLDSGIRTGTDVLKAIALGAKAVFVGRPVLWGLAYNGEEGVKEVLTILKQEFKTAMQLTGCTSIVDLQSKKKLVMHESSFKI